MGSIISITKISITACIVFLLLLPCAHSAAQTVSAAVDRNKILIGEQVTLELRAEEIDSRNYFVREWFRIPDTLSHIIAVKTSAIDTVDVNGVTTYTQHVVLTSFDSGRWHLGPLELVLQARSTGKSRALKTDSIVLNVLPVDVSDMQDYHDVKDIIPVKASTDYTLYIGLALSAIILGVLVWLLLKKSKKGKTAPPPPPHKGTPLEYALKQISELRHQRPPSKIFYTRLTDICRTYFAERLQMSSPQATSDELMIMLSPYMRDAGTRTHFYQFLRLADAVKFARYEPGAEQDDTATGAAVTSLKYIDQITEKQLAHAE